MSVINRREFTRLVAGASIAALSPALLSKAAIAKGSARVVVIGGGAGGASVACILKRAAPQLSVTVIEPHEIYTTCFNSNHYFGGFRTLASLQHTYDGLRKLGINVVNDTATAIDAGKKTVTIAGGTTSPTTASCCRPASTSSTTRSPATRRRLHSRSCRTPGRPARRRCC